MEDGQGLLVARGPLAMVEAALPLTVEDGDTRSRDAREFDLLVDLLTGGWDADGHVLDVSAPLPGPAARATDTDPDCWLRELAALPVQVGLPTSTGYLPSVRLRRLLHARERTCVFPGCTRPATRTDLDHRQAWPHGLTDPHNLSAKSRRCHGAKHNGWQARRDRRTCVITWTSPLGRGGARSWPTGGCS